MPEHIKKNFFYRRVWNEVHHKKFNATFIIVGKPGLGKSVEAQEMALNLDPTFNLNRIVFSIEEFLSLLSKGDPLTGKLNPGQAIIFDEVVTDQGAESRGAMSKTNKLMTYIAANFRARRLIVFICLPSLMQLDKNLREVNVTGIFKVVDKDPNTRKNKNKFFWCHYDPYSQFAMRQYPRLIDSKGKITKIMSMWIPIPSQEFIDAYEVKKMDYLQRNINRWFSMVSKDKEKEKFVIKDLITKIQANPSKYMDGNKFSSAFIKIEENIGRINAEMIAKYLNNPPEKNAIPENPVTELK